jgi:hypothetical protein
LKQAAVYLQHEKRGELLAIAKRTRIKKADVPALADAVLTVMRQVEDRAYQEESAAIVLQGARLVLALAPEGSLATVQAATKVANAVFRLIRGTFGATKEENLCAALDVMKDFVETLTEGASFAEPQRLSSARCKPLIAAGYDEIFFFDHWCRIPSTAGVRFRDGMDYALHALSWTQSPNEYLAAALFEKHATLEAGKGAEEDLRIFGDRAYLGRGLALEARHRVFMDLVGRYQASASTVVAKTLERQILTLQDEPKAGSMREDIQTAWRACVVELGEKGAYGEALALTSHVLKNPVLTPLFGQTAAELSLRFAENMLEQSVSEASRSIETLLALKATGGVYRETGKKACQLLKKIKRLQLS